MVLAFLTGLAQVVGTAMQVAQAFHKTSSTTVVGTGGGSGFWNYYSHSVVSQFSVPTETGVPSYIRKLTERMCQDNGNLWGLFESIRLDFQDLLEFRSYEADEQNYKMYNVVSYENSRNEVHFYIWLIDPPKPNYRGEYFSKFANIKVKINAKYALPYMITHKVKSSFMKTTAKVGIQYLPDPGFDFQRSVESIKIALAPMVLGLVPVPTTFLDVFRNVITGVDGNTGAPLLDYATQQASLASMNQMRTLQQQGVQAAYDSIKAYTTGEMDPKAKGAGEQAAK